MKIGFFGAGNMTKAIAHAIKNNSAYELYFYSPTKTRARNLASELDGNFVEEIELMPPDLDWYFLGFKPQSLNDFNFTFKSNSKIISMLAGVDLIKIQNKFQVNKVIRIMPNTPSRILAGMNLIYFGALMSDLEKDQFIKLMKNCGEISVVDKESLIDYITPFSGCGPGLIFDLAHIFESSLIAFVGDDKILNHSIDSRKIIAQTFLGAAKLMIEESDLSFIELRDQVTSKNGVTFAALEELNKEDISDSYHRAFLKAISRINELKN